MANLPLINLKLRDDIRNTLDFKGATTPDVSSVCNSASVNGWGLDPSYCAGLDASARLVTLRTRPLQIGRFRNYDHTAVAPSYTSNFTISQTAGRSYSMEGTLYLRRSDGAVLDSFYVNVGSSVSSSFSGISVPYRIDFSGVLLILSGDPVPSFGNWAESFSSTSGSTLSTNNFSADTNFTLEVTL